FMIFGSDGCQYCWKQLKKPLKSCHVKPTVKFGGRSIMVWGCFTSQGVGKLIQIDGRMNARLYIQILNEGFLGTLSEQNLSPDDIIFQQDNDPKHTAKLTKKWFDDNQINV